MKSTEAIILAGGFGTRLRHLIKDVPKPMATVNGLPFLQFLLKKLQKFGIEHIILSTGYLHEKIETCFGHSFENLDIAYSQEFEPLGTGGAIQLALTQIQTEHILVLNGDTLFDIDLECFTRFYQEKNSCLAVALRKVKDVNRYGSVEINAENKIIGFAEKNKLQGKGLINGGIYLLNKSLFNSQKEKKAYSFEKDILEKQYRTNNFFGLPFDNYFIDIGVPEDYNRAQNELSAYAN
jgi:D-glycero-alpha-D-manno-heptose 1-phosphate guanylyltransferase